MKAILTLNEILQIENSSEILDPCCPDTGIPLWVTIRPVVIELIMSDLLYGTRIVSRGGASGSSRVKRAATVVRSFAYNAQQGFSVDHDYPIAIMATGARLSKLEGRYFNCLSDYFVSTAPSRTFAVEDLFGWEWPFPRHHNNVILQTPLRVEGVLKGRLRAGAYKKAAQSLVDSISSRAYDLTGWQMDGQSRSWLTNNCKYGAASLLPRYRSYQSIYKKIGARLLIKEQGCYGGPDNASAILAARHLGIQTAEYQHGSISTGHYAYNYAPAIFTHQAYRQTLPEHLLLYGSWWGEQVNAPINRQVIGNPHRSETIGVPAESVSQGRQILVLGDGIETALYLALCERLVALLGDDARVVFRPHPLERANVWSQHPNGFSGKVRIDTHQDLYSSFKNAGAEVSEVSTGLFEAIDIVPKVFIWDTPKARFAYPIFPFQCFSDADELARLILDETAGRVNTEQIEKIWAPN